MVQTIKIIFQTNYRNHSIPILRLTTKYSTVEVHYSGTGLEEKK